MAKTRDVLVHVCVEVALKRRKCHHSKKHEVLAGHSCLVVRQGLGSKNYCRVCAAEILQLASTRLTELQQTVNR